MTAPGPLTIDRLKAVLREIAGADGSGQLAGDIRGRTFDELGYDSLALLELTGHTERDYGIKLPEAALAEVATPTAFVDLVNRTLAGQP